MNRNVRRMGGEGGLCFMEKLLDSEKDKESQYNVMKRDTYNQLLAEVEEAKSAVKKTS
jgi:hypothetical protein